MIELVGAISTVIAVVGVALNNRRSSWCFVLWIASNILAAGVHAWSGIWSFVARDLIFLALAIEGMFLWRTKR